MQWCSTQPTAAGVFHEVSGRGGRRTRRRAVAAAAVTVEVVAEVGAAMGTAVTTSHMCCLLRGVGSEVRRPTSIRIALS